VDRELAAGGIGIGLMPGYAPRSNREEYLALAALAARRQVPTFTHVRHGHPREPGSCVEGVGELVQAAAMTGAQMHLCHLNSTGWRRSPELLELLGRAQGQGLPVTTEMYPWGAVSTVVVKLSDSGYDLLQARNLGGHHGRYRLRPREHARSGPTATAQRA
jgi:hypothetical protein